MFYLEKAVIGQRTYVNPPDAVTNSSSERQRGEQQLQRSTTLEKNMQQDT